MTFSSGVAGHANCTLRGELCAQQKLTNRNPGQWYFPGFVFCRLLSYIILGMFLSYWSFACILWLPIWCFYRFLFLYVCASFLLLLWLTWFLFERERKWRNGVELDGWGGVGDLGEGYNILYENYFS